MKRDNLMAVSGGLILLIFLSGKNLLTNAFLDAVWVQIRWNQWKKWTKVVLFPLKLGQNGRFSPLWIGWKPPQPD